MWLKTNKLLKRTKNSWLFAPSSLILANNFLPLSKALYLQGGLVFYFRLYDDKRLAGLKHGKKINIVNDAVKLYRKDHPLNLTNRLLAVLIVCFVPAFISFLLVGFGLAIGWFALSTMLLEMRAASIESPQIEPYLDQVLD